MSGITELTRNKFTNKQIMNISSHKNQESLAIYQKVNKNEKLRMGLTLGFALTNKPLPPVSITPAQIQQVPAIIPSIQLAAPAIGYQTSPQNPAKKQRIQYEEENPIPSNDDMQLALQDENYDISDQELITLINDTAVENMQPTQYNEVKSSDGTNETHMKQLVQKKTSPRPPLFSNCTFSGNVTININK